MKKVLKSSLKVVGIIILLVVILGLGGWWFINSAFLSFETDYAENIDIKELTIDGYTFFDRNGNGKIDIYEDDRKTTDERVENLLNQMTLEEKIHILKGSGMGSAMGMGKTAVPGAVGTIVPTLRLGLPTIYLSDGPAGLRIAPDRDGENRTYYCTAFPIGTLLSSTWNTNLVTEVGTAMGNEAKEYGIDVILGPGANIHRHPLCGRNFEYYSEDPVLTGYIGAAMVNGIESEGIGTSVKHFVANNQETDRNSNDAIVSDRAMREIYLKGFEIIAKKSQPWTIMSSYNKVNGIYVPERKDLLTDILRDDWKYQGLVMTDWFGGNNAPTMIKAGNDLLEPGTNKQWKALKKAAANGTLTEEEINTSARRILRLILQSKKMQNYQYSNNPELDVHAKIARTSAAEGMVLLKNEQTLPIQKNKNVALMGVTSFEFIAGGTGSGDVNEAYTISLEEGLKNAGFEINEKAKKAFEIHKASNEKEFIKPEGYSALTTQYFPPRMNYANDELKEIVSSSDIGIITIGRNSGEGGDRVEKDDFLLSKIEQNMIAKVCKAFHAKGKKVVVVMNIGGVIETDSWKEHPDAILLAWQGGQEGGNSVADILSGKTNPSGKLPMTFPINLNDHASNANFPLEGGKLDVINLIFGSRDEKPENEKIKNKDYTNYEEGIYVGYRHFDKENIDVSYPFGFGLSYSTFDLSNLNLTLQNDIIEVTVSVTNSGSIAGKEVLQVYTSKTDTKIDRPLKELRTFTKTKSLNPEEAATISFKIPVSELSYWSEEASQWRLEKGLYSIQVGTSSRDIALSMDVEIN
ncbi:beta-glucosidase [Winogradskyella sp. PG-2]|uniref:beta-glucosidase n=1 Tax=Winogradskyella sp. PG-2 TaxID=754409 RepID=UPI0004588A8E|nr:glycoside hydrolase family 3 C-terminal domain-containing protein [Winogradskyella sp. PG-2]BAO76539.1 beta-glucosidase [Winogradskyella sp. PG-2]